MLRCASVSAGSRQAFDKVNGQQTSVGFTGHFGQAKAHAGPARVSRLLTLATLSALHFHGLHRETITVDKLTWGFTGQKRIHCYMCLHGIDARIRMSLALVLQSPMGNNECTQLSGSYATICCTWSSVKVVLKSKSSSSTVAVMCG